MKKTTKRTIKSFVLGIIVTTIFMSIAVGAQVKDTIDVVFNKVNVTLNGEKVDIDNLLYDGTTYVPLREIAEMLDKAVEWDGDTSTANIIDGKIEPLTEDELAYFNGDSFFNGEYLNIRNQFLNSLYSEAGEIDLFQLFYSGSGIDEEITDDELKEVMVRNNIRNSVENIPTGCGKVSRSNMDKILTEHMGITLADTDEVGLDNFTYISEYDAYYHLHGDTNYISNIKFSHGERECNIIRLFYDADFLVDGDKVLTLEEKDGQYIFISNQRLNNKIVTSIGDSTKFTKKEISEAIDTVKNEFDFEGCTLKKVWYQQEKSDYATSGYLEYGRGSINGVKPENVIVLFTEFDVDSSGGDGSFEPDSTYDNWQFILIREDIKDDWKIDDWGY